MKIQISMENSLASLTLKNYHRKPVFIFHLQAIPALLHRLISCQTCLPQNVIPTFAYDVELTLQAGNAEFEKNEKHLCLKEAGSDSGWNGWTNSITFKTTTGPR